MSYISTIVTPRDRWETKKENGVKFSCVDIDPEKPVVDLTPDDLHPETIESDRTDNQEESSEVITTSLPSENANKAIDASTEENKEKPMNRKSRRNKKEEA